MTRTRQSYTRSDFRLPEFLTLSVIVLSTILFELGTLFVLKIVQSFIYIQLLSFWYLLIILPLCVLIVGGMIIRTSQSRPLRKYVRTMQLQLEWFKRVYTPLSILSDVQEMTQASPDGTTQGSLPTFEELVQQQVSPFVLLGAPGTGKTITLRVYQDTLLTQLSEHISGNNKIPIFISFKDYNMFLNREKDYKSLMDYLQEELESTRYLRTYVGKWFEEGRFLFLCDDLHEVDSEYLPSLCEELLAIIRDSRNNVYMTCEEMAYQEQPLFATLVSEAYAQKKYIAPLDTEQVAQFIGHYINAGQPDQQGQPWAYSLDEMLHLINDLGVRKYCTNPSLLFLLMKTVHSMSSASRQQVQTRGLLLQAVVLQHLREQSNIMEQGGVAEDDLLHFISQFAGIAHRMKLPSGIPLGTSPLSPEGLRHKRSYGELAATIETYFIAPPIDETLLTDDDDDDDALQRAFSREHIASMLKVAENVGFITISPNNLIRFPYALYEEYFVAAYLRLTDTARERTRLPFEKELLADVKNWHKPLCMWASLLPEPMLLENRLAATGRNNALYAQAALTLGMMCVCERLKRSSSEYVLPASLEELLRQFLHNSDGIDKLAAAFTQCMQEYGSEVYRFLLPLVRLAGVDVLLLKLEKQAVAELLFGYLCEAIEQNPYGVVPVLSSILGRLGEVAIPLAITASKPGLGLTGTAFDVNMALRKTAITILGRTHEQRAVEPLISYLREGGEVGEASYYALLELGPGRVLEPIIKELMTPTFSSNHLVALFVLQTFLETPSLEQIQYQKIIDMLLHSLSSTYEPSIQQQAKSMLLQEAKLDQSRADRVIKSAIYRLTSPHTNAVQVLNIQFVLGQIGRAATSHLLVNLKQQSEVALIRILQVLDQVRDERALPALVSLIAAPADAIKQQIASILVGYGYQSVPHLVQLILAINGNDREAEAAFPILKDIGEASVEYIIQELPRIVPGRTQLLVRVLEHTRDKRAIPSLLELLKLAQKEHFLLLAQVVIQALGQMPDKRSILPLLDMLAYTGIEPSFLPLQNEISKALSTFDQVGLDELFAALDSEQETTVTQGVRYALFLMKSFPQRQLLHVFEHCSDTFAQQIILVFRSKGNEVASFLVEQLCHSNERIRYYVGKTLDSMDEQHIIQALLDANHSECRSRVAIYLRKYPQSTVPRLVHLLSDSQRGDAAVLTLTEFGPAIIPALAPGLNELRNGAYQRTQGIIENLVRQHVEVLPQVFRLFPLLASPNDQRGHSALLQVLTNQLAEISTPALLDSLGSADQQIRGGVVQALVLLIRKDTEYSKVVLQKVCAAFEVETQRPGAIAVLEHVGEKAVENVILLTAHKDIVIRQAACGVMSNIGTPALDAVLRFMSDPDPMRREMGEDILHGMKTAVVFDTLIDLLASPDSHKVEKALTLLLGRVRTDATHGQASTPTVDQKIIPALLEHIQTRSRASVHLRIIAFLLLLPKTPVLRALSQILSKPPYAPSWLEWLAPLFLMLGMEGNEAKNTLLRMLQSPALSFKLRIEIVSILGMMEAHQIVEEHAAFLGRSSDISRQTGNLPTADELEIAQRALGGLLVNGKWNAKKLREKLHDVQDETGQHELYSILLGESYVPKIKALRQQVEAGRLDLLKEKQKHETEILRSRMEGEQWKRRFDEKNNEFVNKIKELEGVKKQLETAEGMNGTLTEQAETLQKKYDSLNERFQNLRRASAQH